ncbi:Gfo/Idh/MocA family protein [Microbacterium sp. NPDC055683]
MIRAGILGAAGIAPQAFVRPARRRDDIEIVAVAARHGSAAERFAARWRIPRALAGYEALLSADDIDLVYIALPPSEHARWTTAALEAGKDVLCEKPIAMDAREAARVAEVAEATGRIVIEAFHDHYHPLLAALREIIAAGRIGRVRHLDASFTADNPFAADSIRHVPELGGGALMDLGCYPVHWIRTLGGGEPRVDTARHTANPLGADLAIDARLVLPDGATADLHASMAPGSPFSAPVEIIGSRGRIAVDNLVLPHLGHSLVLETDAAEYRRTVAGDETYDHELDAVVAAIRSRRDAATGPADFVANMRVIDDIYRCAGVRRPQALEEAR